MGSEKFPSAIIFAINANKGMRDRVIALVRSKWWNDPTANPLAPVPLDPLAWAVATNPTILAFVTDKIVDDDIGGAISQIVEGDLEYVVFEALKRIDELTTVVPEPEPEPAPEVTP